MRSESKILRVSDFWKKRSTKIVGVTKWISIGDYLLQKGIDEVNEHWEYFVKIWNYCNTSKDIENCGCVTFSGHDNPVYSFVVNRNFNFLEVVGDEYFYPIDEKLRREFFLEISGYPLPVVYERVISIRETAHRIIAFGKDSGYTESLDVAINRVVDIPFPNPIDRIKIRRLLKTALVQEPAFKEIPNIYQS